MESTDFAARADGPGAIPEHVEISAESVQDLRLQVRRFDVRAGAGEPRGTPAGCPTILGSDRPGDRSAAPGISARADSASARWPARPRGGCEEGTGQHSRHGALQRPGQHQRQPEAAEGGQAAGGQGADRGRAPDEAAPGAARLAPSASAGVSLWRREMATTDPAPTAKPTRAKAGPPAASRGPPP